MYILALAGMVMFSACSSDDDDNKTNLKTPKYESISAKYEITEQGSNIQSLELTASGNFIIIKKSTSYYAPERRGIAQNIFMNRINATRAHSYRDIIYGKFVKLGNDKYELEDWGTVTITKSEDNYVNLSITYENGQNEVLGARKEEQYKSSSATDNLCRSWNISEITLSTEMNGKKFEKTAKHNNMKELFTSYMNWMIKNFAGNIEVPKNEIAEMIDEYVEEYNESKPLSVIFTKSGSYMVHYNNDMMGIATWKWENKDENVIRYSWDHSNINNGGLCDISYSGNMLLIKESKKQEGVSVSVTYGMTEMK